MRARVEVCKCDLLGSRFTHHARDRFEFLDWFEGIVVSGEERVAKPDPRIFAVLLERFGLDPAATLFIDDAERNVAAARDAGMHAVVFTGADELRRVLADAGVLPISSASDA